MKKIKKIFFGLVVVAVFVLSLVYVFYPHVPYKKSGVVLNDHMEATPFVWNGDIYYLVTAREVDTDKSKLKIIRFSDGHVVSSFAEDYGLASAYVTGGTLFVVGTKGWTSETSKIGLFSSTDLKSFNGPKLIKHGSAKQKLFNTSAVALNGETIVAYEVDEPGLVPFSARFMGSRDGTTYHDVGGVFGSDFYAACPTIRFIGGYYYLWYLAVNKNTFETRIARSKDLSSWEISPFPFMTPGRDEDVNTSDVDFVTHDGKTYIFYSISDQKTYSKLTYAIFDGDAEALVGYYFDWRYGFYKKLEQFKLLNAVSRLVKIINN